MQARHRLQLVDLEGDRLPALPGGYSLWRDDNPTYVGKGKSLVGRFGKERRGVSITKSALRPNVAEYFGIATAYDVKTGRPVALVEADRVNAWLDGCMAS